MKLKKARNGSIPVPEMTITHDGFGFIGWSYDKLSTNPEYIVGDFFKDDKDISLYAIWKKIGDNSNYYVKTKRKITMNDQTFVVGKKFKIKTKSESGGEFTFKSKNKKIVNFDSSGKGKGIKCGKVKVVVTVVEDGLYKKTTKTITVTIVKKKG